VDKFGVVFFDSGVESVDACKACVDNIFIREFRCEYIVGLFSFTHYIMGCVIEVCKIGDIEIDEVPCVFIEFSWDFFKVEKGCGWYVFGG
jgi:hypothetical protein